MPFSFFLFSALNNGFFKASLHFIRNKEFLAFPSISFLCCFSAFCSQRCSVNSMASFIWRSISDDRLDFNQSWLVCFSLCFFNCFAQDTQVIPFFHQDMLPAISFKSFAHIFRE